MNYTPGPWESETEYECAVYALNRQMKIADIRGWGYLTGKGQGGLGLSSEEASKIQNANARAIAAVPDMLELIHEMLLYVSSELLCLRGLGKHFEPEREAARAMLEKMNTLLRQIEGEEEAQ